MSCRRPCVAIAVRILCVVVNQCALAQTTSPAPGGDTTIGLELHAPAPDFDLAYFSAPAGAPDTLAALRGKVVVLEFWATWCSPCIAAIPHMNDLAEKLAGEPVVFISISRDDDRAVLAQFLEKYPMKSWVAMEGQGRPTSQAYGVGFIPHTVVIDQSRNIAAITQPTALTEAAIRDVLAGKPIDLPRKIDKPADPEWDREPGALEESNPAAIAHAILQYSDATGTVTQHKANSGRLSGDGLPWQVLVQLAYDAEPTQVGGTPIPELDNQMFRVSVQAPHNDDARARAMLRGLLDSALGLTAEWKHEDREVVVLARTEGAPSPKQSEAQASGGFTRHGRIALTRIPMSQLAQLLGAFSGNMIGVDETNLGGDYDITLTWTNDDEPSLAAALAEYGLELRKETREVPILHPHLDPAPAKPAR